MLELEMKQAMKMRQDGNYEECYRILVKLAALYPDDGSIQYQCAWSCDNLGKENEAVPYYERAISLGLPKEELKGAYIGLGSTYRTLGQYEQSQETFLKGMEVFPENNALKVFYAMTLYNLKNHHKAMELLLLTMSEVSKDEEVNRYKRAITFYADKLDEVWD